MTQPKKCRQYSIEYLKYGFIESPVNNSLPICLISSLKDHLNKIHNVKKDNNLSYFQKLKENFNKNFEKIISRGRWIIFFLESGR